MSAVPATTTESRSPAAILAARSASRHIVEPFQYYSEADESIWRLDWRNHRFTASLYLHFDAQNRPLAQLLKSDGSGAEEALGDWPSMPPEELQAHEAEPADFDRLLAEMHLHSPQGQLTAGERRQITELQALGKEPPVVIGGCGRSGTTLLLSILGAHPNILAFPEEVYAFYPRPFRARQLLWEIERLGRDRAWRRWCEKTPKNVRAFGDISRAFDGRVRLIHLVRDGRAVVTSHHPNASQRYYISPERWVADVQAGLAQKDQCLLVRYEDLVSQPEATLEEICDYIGEDFDERLLRHEGHTTVTENKAWEQRQALALHTERVAGWQAPEHRARVEALLQEPGARELLAELGYLS